MTWTSEEDLYLIENYGMTPQKEDLYLIENYGMTPQTQFMD